MKFISVKYKNYRCFMDVCISFKTTEDKNIALIVAPNGGGKTEMLFSFQWVLYGFDFSRLKNKDHTPYALNSALYQELSNSKKSSSQTCWVELTFESEGISYTVRREETYVNSNNRISSSQTVSFWSTKPNGETTAPITEPDLIEKNLQRIIPQNILGGIIFDGERMKDLNNSNADAIKAVQEVIKQITNEALFELCKVEFSDLKKQLHKAIRSTSKENKLDTIESMNTLISQSETSLEINKTLLQGKRESLIDTDGQLKQIHNELEQLKETRENEIKREGLRKSLHDQNDLLDKCVDNFYKDLNNGYMLICEPVLAAVEESLEHFDVPEGLTVEAVKSILKRDTCICGHPLGDEERRTLENMLTTLPPDNINSTIHEIVRQMRISKKNATDGLKRTFGELRSLESKIATVKQDIATISEHITDGASANAKELETKNTNLLATKTKLESDISELDNQIKATNTKLESLRKQFTQATKNNETVRVLDQQNALLDKYLAALEEIDEQNKLLSLHSINSYLSDAYNLVSEDTERNLYIVQYDEAKRYQMIPYSKEKFDTLYRQYQEDGTYRTLQITGHTDEQIREIIIISLQENSSTGQGKINSLAFAKAILDYSREDRGEESTEISRDYPFLIDSPFTELSGDNIVKSANNINKFANQIILMISDESLSGTEQYIKRHTNAVTRLAKDVAKGFSYVERE